MCLHRPLLPPSEEHSIHAALPLPTPESVRQQLPAVFLRRLKNSLSTRQSRAGPPGAEAGAGVREVLVRLVLQGLKQEWGAFPGSDTWLPNNDCGAISRPWVAVLLRRLKSGLTGSIPTSIVNLRVDIINLSNNHLRGPLPPSLLDTDNFQELDLSYNQLTGSIPTSYSQGLGSMLQLRLQGNRLTGSIPGDMLAALFNLQELLLNSNQLAGNIPIQISEMFGLTRLNLGSNQLTGTLPIGMSLLTQLQSLSVANSLIGGYVHEALAIMTTLTLIDISNSGITGTLTDGMSVLRDLQELDLSNNRLHGTIPTLLTGLVRLTLLNLRNNQLTGPILQPIPSSVTVYNLDLNYFSSGFSSPPDCYQGSISFRFNCLETPTQGFSCPTPATPSAADAAVQRPEELCAAFCGVSATDPPCDGHGVCYLDGPSRVPTCDCESGFVNGESPGTCVVEGSEDPVIVQPTAAQTEVKGGAAVANDGSISLTASQPNTWGAAFLQLPIPLFSFSLKAGACGRPLAFTVYFSFSILKPATASRAAMTAAGDAGDGFAFVIAATDAATGGSSGSSDGSGGGGSLGYAGMDERSIAVEFDTAKSTDANDPDNNHVGISVRGNTSSIATAKVPFTLNDGRPKQAWVVFEPSPSSSGGAASGSSNSSGGSAGWLRVFLSAKGSPRPSKAVVAMQVSLCEFLQPSAAEASFLMGFTASSSHSPQLHSILEWNITTGLCCCSLLLPAAPPPFSSAPFLLLFPSAPCFPPIAVRSALVPAQLLPSPSSICQQFGFQFSEASLAPVGANLFFRYASAGVQALLPVGGEGGEGGSGKEEEVWVVNQAFSWTDQGLSWPVQNQGACGDCWAYAVVGSIEMAYGILSNLTIVPHLSVTQLRSALGSSCSQGNSPSQAFQYLVTLNAKSKVGLTEDGGTGVVVSGGGATKSSSQSPLCSMPILALLAQALGIPCGKGRTPGPSKPSGGAFRVNGFERTAFHGWFGLLLAVQRQPVVVHVQATVPSFLDYDGLSKYADPSCFTYNLNHVVLLVGYRLTGSDPTFPHMAPPFWIIRNSWGPEWGDGGHMRMDIQGGDGVCGINTLPGIYPVVRAAKDPCNVNGTTSGVFGPLFNPCGNFTCTPTPDGASNHCDCNDPRFVEALQPDNSRTCAYMDACRAAVHNPCAVGTCVNDGKGSYSCVCPPGFRQGTTVDGTFSCGPGDSSSTYKVVSLGVTCADIHPVYGLTLAHLQQQNPRSSSCRHGGERGPASRPHALLCLLHHIRGPRPLFLPPLTSTPPHSPLPTLPPLPSLPPLAPLASLRPHLSHLFLSPAPFPLSPPVPHPLISSHHPPWSLPLVLPPSLPSPQGDICESLATYFALTAGCPTPTEPCAAAFQALNPGLDCSGSGELLPSQAVCVERRAESAAALLIPVCSQFYLVQAGETCDQIRSVPSPPLSPLEFFRLNPGIKCSRLVPKTDVGSLTGFEVPLCSPLHPSLTQPSFLLPLLSTVLPDLPYALGFPPSPCTWIPTFPMHLDSHLPHALGFPPSPCTWIPTFPMHLDSHLPHALGFPPSPCTWIPTFPMHLDSHLPHALGFPPSPCTWIPTFPMHLDSHLPHTLGFPPSPCTWIPTFPMHLDSHLPHALGFPPSPCTWIPTFPMHLDSHLPHALGFPPSPCTWIPTFPVHLDSHLPHTLGFPHRFTLRNA
ncbi:unnamed protein product [Closterium sp. Naga37s-1]|nr:unnamed protein product [Closterium sp. Naga37s-1]